MVRVEAETTPVVQDPPRDEIVLHEVHRSTARLRPPHGGPDGTFGTIDSGHSTARKTSVADQERPTGSLALVINYLIRMGPPPDAVVGYARNDAIRHPRKHVGSTAITVY